MGTVGSYIEKQLERGRYHFKIEEIANSIAANHEAVSRALLRLRQKGVLATPHRGFYVVVPPEYRSLGCLPPEQFVPQLMEHVGEPYHVALLSAAQIHGAAHQRPQRFQVMLRKPRTSIACGKVSVDFHVRRDLELATTTTVRTPRGYLRLSTPEATALELVGYARHAGGLDNVATVLSELAESIAPDRLADEARTSPLAWAQRLGYLLDLVGRQELTGEIHSHVRGRARRVAPLDASLPRTGAPRLTKWKIAINTKVEPDL